MKKIYLTLIFLLALTVNMAAQEKRPLQWFISGGPSSVIALNGSSNTSLGGKISAGTWLNGYTGFRANVEVANIWMENDFTAMSYGAGIDWMINLLAMDTYHWTKGFFLNTFVGVGYNYYSLDKNYSDKYSKINTVDFNFSLQAIYKLNPKLSLFFEPGIKIGPKFYDIENKKDPYVSLMLTAGVTFNL